MVLVPKFNSKDVCIFVFDIILISISIINTSYYLYQFFLIHCIVCPFIHVIFRSLLILQINNLQVDFAARFRQTRFFIFSYLPMFNDLKVLIISLENFPEKEADKVQLSLENNGATTYIKKDYDNTINYFLKYEINHIITETIDFIEFDTAFTSMIPITTPEWVFESILVRKPLHTSKFNPDPKLFLKNCFICIGDDVPTSDKEIIYGGVRAFGGLYLDMLTSHTTHLITNDLNSDKAILAASCDVDIKIVSPNWIDDCLKMGKKLNENDYLVDASSIVPDSPIKSKSFTETDVNNMLKYNANFFNDKRFFISNDYNLSKNLKLAITSLILKNGGKISSKFGNNIDVYIGKYRSGKEFQQSFKSNRIIIANLQWLYSVIINNRWVLPVNSQLLNYPIPMKPLTDFQGLKFSITNYSHDARYYLSKIITIMGGTFTKNLTKDNDFLIVGRPTGSKYEAATKIWLKEGSPIVKVVNHLWLEECYANWELLNYDKPKFQFLGSTKGIENLLGRTKLNASVLKYWIDVDVDDSMDDDVIKPAIEETDYSSEEEPEEEEDEPSVEASHGITPDMEDKVEGENNHTNIPPVIATPAEEEKESEPSLLVGEEYSTPAPEVEEQTKENQEAQDKQETQDEQTTTFTPTRKSRSAKEKATMKLHDNMADLIKHQELLKSSRKMNDYMKDLEDKTPKRKSSSQDKENITPPSKRLKTPASPREEVSAATKLSLNIIMTGCESQVDLSKDDVNNLKKYGIKISTGPTKVNCLVAPKILRTEKFLTSLSKVNNIIHPNYLIDLRRALSRGDDPDIDINDYRLDKVILVEAINEQLGYESGSDINGVDAILNSNRGELFSHYKLNLSSNLNGGFDVLSKILKSHGANELKLVKYGSKSFCETGDQKIVIVNKAKDSKLIKSLDSSFTIVEWDWCVKSIFKQTIEDVTEFKV